jgi:DNA processing protein
MSGRIIQVECPDSVIARWRGRPPACLHAIGNIRMLSGPLVAVIGTRNPSPRGCQCACAWAAEVVRAGASVLSGAAPGIDLESHCAALQAGGNTVIVPPIGLRNYSPPDALRKQLRGPNWLMLSNLAPDTPAARWTPVERNRLVAALADAVLVIETPLRSGTAYVIRFVLRRKGPVLVPQYTPPVPESARGNATLLSAEGIKLAEQPNATSRQILRRWIDNALARRASAGSPRPDDLFDDPHSQ